MKKPKISAVITTKNEEKTIGCLLQSLKKQTYPNFEIIVVDHPETTDRTAQIAKKYTPLVFKKGPERSRQRNFGVQKATGKHVLILDADMEIEPKVIEDCVIVIEADKRIKAVIIPERSFGQGFWAKCKALERECYVGDETIEAARFFDKKVYWEFGGYDEKITGPEDWDLPLRIGEKYKIGRVASFINHNEKKQSLLEIMKKKYYYARKFSFYQKKHPRTAWYHALLIFRPAFYRNWRKLLHQPVMAAGMFLMLGMSMLSGMAGVIMSEKEKVL